jgi:hypothetical protein
VTAMVAGLIPPDVVKIVLFAAFGFYIFSGLFMFVLGIVYMTDVGAIGTGGVYMIVFGLIMWVIAGIGIWATKTDNWKTLFAVELVNIALFLVRSWLPPPARCPPRRCYSMPHSGLRNAVGNAMSAALARESKVWA